MPSKRRPRARRARRTGANRTKSKLTKVRISHAGRTGNHQAVTRHQLTRQRALAVLARIRRGESLSQAAHNEHTTARTVRQHVGSALIRHPQTSHFVAKSGDTFRRDINVLGFDGYVPVVVRSSNQAQLASVHLVAVNRFLRPPGDSEWLKPFVGKRVGGVELLTDPDRIQILAAADLVKLDALYRNNHGGEQDK
jgi:hypothetical protein